MNFEFIRKIEFKDSNSYGITQQETGSEIYVNHDISLP